MYYYAAGPVTTGPAALLHRHLVAMYYCYYLVNCINCVTLCQIVMSLFVAVILDNLELEEDIKRLKQARVFCVYVCCLTNTYHQHMTRCCCHS